MWKCPWKVAGKDKNKEQNIVWYKWFACKHWIKENNIIWSRQKSETCVKICQAANSRLSAITWVVSKAKSPRWRRLTRKPDTDTLYWSSIWTSILVSAMRWCHIVKHLLGMVDTWWKELWLDDSKVINANHHHGNLSVTDYLRHTCSIDLIKASLYCGRDKASKALKSLNKQILIIKIILLIIITIINNVAKHCWNIQIHMSLQ